MRILLTCILLTLLAGCAGQPEKVYWQNFNGEDEFWTWVCRYDPAKKVREYPGSPMTQVTQYDAQCFRTLNLKQ